MKPLFLGALNVSPHWINPLASIKRPPFCLFARRRIPITTDSKGVPLRVYGWYNATSRSWSSGFTYKSNPPPSNNESLVLCFRTPELCISERSDYLWHIGDSPVFYAVPNLVLKLRLIQIKHQYCSNVSCAHKHMEI